MATGIKVERNAKGEVKNVILSTSSDSEIVQDLIDLALIQEAKEEPGVPWKEAKKQLARKLGIE